MPQSQIRTAAGRRGFQEILTQSPVNHTAIVRSQFNFEMLSSAFFVIQKEVIIGRRPEDFLAIRELVLTHSIRDTDLSVPTLFIRDTDSSVCTHIAMENMHRTSLNCVFHRVIS